MKHFITEETGAVTVDWVVLTAALVGLGLATMSVVSGGVENVSGDTARQLALLDVQQSPFTSLQGFTIDGFTHAIDDGLTESTYADYSGDSYTDTEVETFLADLHTQLSAGSAATNDVHVDQYAGAYAAAQDRGIDVSGYTDPSEFSDIYHENNG